MVFDVKLKTSSVSGQT